MLWAEKTDTEKLKRQKEKELRRNGGALFYSMIRENVGAPYEKGTGLPLSINNNCK